MPKDLARSAAYPPLMGTAFALVVLHMQGNSGMTDLRIQEYVQARVLLALPPKGQDPISETRLYKSLAKKDNFVV